MKTNRELSTEIKAILKQNGIKRNEVSVRVSDCGYSTSINIKIKVPTISRRMIQKLLNHYEDIDRDEFNGEILQGGNTYLFVNYDDNVFNSEEVINKYLPLAQKTIDSITETDSFIKIADGLFYYEDKQTGEKTVRQTLSNEPCSRFCDDVINLSQYIYFFMDFGSIKA